MSFPNFLGLGFGRIHDGLSPSGARNELYAETDEAKGAQSRGQSTSSGRTRNGTNFGDLGV